MTGRTMEVPAHRVGPWLAGFERRHGPATVAATSTRVVFTAADQSVAECEVPFPPMEVVAGSRDAGVVAHVARDRTIGVLLVRLGGYAAGVFQGDVLVSSKVGSRLVHGRNAAGGQSQQRFARRREGQARVALREAADVAARILIPALASLDAVVVGGDRGAVDKVLADQRLEPLRPLLASGLLSVPDPRLRVLQSTPRLFRAVQMRLTETVTDTEAADEPPT